MDKKRLTDLIDEQIEAYINNIAFELEDAHDRWFEDFGFPMFAETANQYHEQVYFQSYLEHYTRRLVNCILKEILDLEAPDEYEWPELNYTGIYRGYTNKECEQKFDFELIDRPDKVGYRYTTFEYEEDTVLKLLAKGNVDSIAIVLWESREHGVYFGYKDTRIRVINLFDLFHELFFDWEKDEINTFYDLFSSKVAKAVNRAKSMISLVTLPGFTPSYLYKNRGEIVSKLKNEIAQLTCFYINTEEYREKYNTSQLIDTYKLSDYFLNNRFERVFVGTSDYAKSYMTSEYLYQYFKGNPMFDYTPIVSGYLKSIEQLLYTICASFLRVRNKEKDGEDLSSKELGSLIYFIKQRSKKIFRREIRDATDLIIGCLHSYRSESRNNLFHKDYLNSWNRVEEIRTNTIFIYAMILGSVDHALLEDPSVLGILDIEYDQLFCLIDNAKNVFYSFVLAGEEYVSMQKEPRYEGLVFNENGSIMNTIIFKKLAYDGYESVEISRSNIPSEVWVSDTFGNRRSKIWPAE